MGGRVKVVSLRVNIIYLIGENSYIYILDEKTLRILIKNLLVYFEIFVGATKLHL